MSGESVPRPRFSKQHFDILKRTSDRFFGEIPAFVNIWDRAIEASVRVGLADSSPSLHLVGYVQSLRSTCEQALYAIQCLEDFSTHEPSNITEFYVAYFLNDFVIRVKTGTDLLALIIKSVYGLDIDDKKCSLENGSVVSYLRRRSNIPIAEQLAREIDRVRNWLEPFDTLRDIAVHQGGFQLMMAGDTEYPVHIQIPLLQIVRDRPIYYDPKDPLKALKPFVRDDPLIKFLVQIGSKSASKYLITANPVLLCKKIWKLLSMSIEKILRLCGEDLLDRLSGQKLPLNRTSIRPKNDEQ